MAKTFRLKKDITTKYKSDIKTKGKEKKVCSVKKLSNEEIILQNKDKIMVCVDNEEEIESPLQYCFVSREIERDSGTKISKVNVEFNIKLDEIVKKLKLKSSYKNLYLLNGTPVFELSHIPPNENVIIISRQIQLRLIDDIIDNDLVREFFEYGTNKDIRIYSQSHIKSRMASLIQVQQMTEDKKKDVLHLLDNGEQLDSEELGKMLSVDSSAKNKDLVQLIDKQFKVRARNSIFGEYSPQENAENNHQRFNMSSDSEKFDVDRVITKGIDSGLNSNRELDKDVQVQEYLSSKQPLSENTKLRMYQEIGHHYKDKLKRIQLEYEETEDDAENVVGGNDEEECLQKSTRLPNIGENLEALLKRLKKPKKKLDYFEIKRAMAENKDNTVATRSKLQEDLMINQHENLTDASNEKKDGKKDFIEENKKALKKKKSDIKKLSKLNRELFLKNIPKNLEEKKLTRRELHWIYIIYKALCEVTSQRHKEYNLGDGIDYHSFRNGINQVFLQSDEVAEKIFYTIDYNFSDSHLYQGFLNWEEFINAMVVIRAKTVRDKIDLFIKIADEDGNGQLSKEEIFKLAKICLKKFVTAEDGFLDDLCEYFTKLIFNSVNLSMDQEIPLTAIKEAIISVTSSWKKFRVCFACHVLWS